jgi:hypothetical protein
MMRKLTVNAASVGDQGIRRKNKLEPQRANEYALGVRSPAITLLSVLLLGCAPRATSEGYQLMMNTWINHSTDELFTQWGAPTRTIALQNGGQVLEYVKAWQKVTGPTTYPMPVTNFGSGTVYAGNQTGYVNTSETTYVPLTLPGSVENYSCTTRFRVSAKHIIEQASWEGNGCVSQYRAK